MTAPVGSLNGELAWHGTGGVNPVKAFNLGFADLNRWQMLLREAFPPADGLLERHTAANCSGGLSVISLSGADRIE